MGSGSGKASGTGIAIVVIAAISWAAGSVWSQTAPTARRPLVTTGMEMLCGGIGCLITAAATGEFADLHVGQINYRGWIAFGYLIERTGSYGVPFTISAGLLALGIVAALFIDTSRTVEADEARERLMGAQEAGAFAFLDAVPTVRLERHTLRRPLRWRR